MSSLVNLECPNCGCDLAEENLHSNILQCPRCNSYTYYESGMFNQNVFFGLMRCQTYQLDKLRSTIIDKYVNQASLRAIWNFKYLHAERLLIPVREIDLSGVPKAVTLLEENRETAGENADVRELLKNRNDIEKLFHMQYLHPLRLSDVRDEIDSSGYITHTTVLPVGRTKRDIDTAYNLRPDSLLRILYLPVYRLSFNDKSEKKLCFANGELTGLEFKEPKKWDSFDIEFDSLSDLASVLGVISIPLSIITIVAIILTTGGASVKGGDSLTGALILIAFYIVFAIVLALIYASAITIGALLFSKLPVSLNVVSAAKKWIIKRMLTKKFKLNEKRR